VDLGAQLQKLCKKTFLGYLMAQQRIYGAG
jgi:hypothetical protein